MTCSSTSTTLHVALSCQSELNQPIRDIFQHGRGLWDSLSVKKFQRAYSPPRATYSNNIKTSAPSNKHIQIIFQRQNSLNQFLALDPSFPTSKFSRRAAKFPPTKRAVSPSLPDEAWNTLWYYMISPATPPLLNPSAPALKHKSSGSWKTLQIYHRLRPTTAPTYLTTSAHQ